MANITLDCLQRLLKDEYPDVTIQNFEYAPGVRPGDSYTAAIYRVFLTGTRRPNNSSSSEPWECSIIFKLPPNDTLRRESFKKAFENEAGFYTKIWPALNSFQRQWKIQNPFNSIPKCYLAQEDCIVMKDLKAEGFVMVDKRQGLALDKCKLILKHLAQLHALSLAMKAQDPDKFSELINAEDGISEKLFVTKNYDFMRNYYKKTANIAISMVEQELAGREDKDIYLNKFRNFCNEDSFFHTMVDQVAPREPLAVVCHGDSWINNFLFKDSNGKMAELYIVDFQLTRYSSLAVDLVMILYLCMEREMRTEHYTDLLKYYTKELHSRIVQMSAADSIYNTSLNEDALYEMVRQELDRCLPFGLGISMSLFPFMTLPMADAYDPFQLCDDDDVKDCDLLTETGIEPLQYSSAECRKKITQLLVELVDNGTI